MNGQNYSTPTSSNINAPRKGLAGGIILVAVGLMLLAGQFFELGIWPILALGLIFLLAGVLSHKAGLLIPGGILSGCGAAIIAIQNNWPYTEGTPESSGGFLLIFSLGWFAITLLSKLFTRDTQTWALIPGGIMALIGGLVLMGPTGLEILKVLGSYWPIILILIGGWTLYKVWRDRQ